MVTPVEPWASHPTCSACVRLQDALSAEQHFKKRENEMAQLRQDAGTASVFMVVAIVRNLMFLLVIAASGAHLMGSKYAWIARKKYLERRDVHDIQVDISCAWCQLGGPLKNHALGTLGSCIRHEELYDRQLCRKSDQRTLDLKP